MESHAVVERRFLRSLAVVMALALVIGVSVKSPKTLAAQAAGSQDPLISPVEQADCLAFGDARTVRHPVTGVLRFVGTEPGRAIPNPRPADAAQSPEAAARAYLGVCGSLFGLQPQSVLPGVSDQANQLRVIGNIQADGQRRIVRFQQIHQSVPILGGELIVHVDAANNILAVVGKTEPKAGIDTTPVVNAADAQATALEVVAKSYGVDAATLTTTTPERWIYAPTLIGPDAGSVRLVWRMDVVPNALQPIRELVLVDARRGSVALRFNQVESARDRRTYTANNTTTLPGTLVCNESNPNCTGGDAAAVGAHVNAGDTYNFYQTTLGRDSINGSGLPLISTVHYDVNYDNAFWQGSQMVYGDAKCYSCADDVVGHELTHGVTQYTSNLFYYYQSGAINESLSDVFGEFVDLTNNRGTDTPGVRWLMGEDVTPGGAIRNMQNPPQFSHPDRMTSAFYYRGAQDNGGVHLNSGLNNKAAFLMTDGGTFNGQTITALGITKVAKIYYEVQTHLLTSGSDYADLANALYQACNNLVGSSGIVLADCQEVLEATLAVEMTLQPTGGPFNPEAPVCAAGQTVSNLFFDNLENGPANFVFGAAVGTVRWTYDLPGTSDRYAHSGVHALFGNDFPGAITDSSATMAASVMNLPANAFLHFAHSYGFEAGFDGGVVEYSTNAGMTWVDAGPLFNANGYNGTLVASSNPLGGRMAFYDDSHGYISSRANLATLAGQNVRFRWRMGLDSSVADLGWAVDDVRIYTCVTAPTPGTVTGRVRNAATMAPIAGAQVTTGAGGVTATTDSTGLYTLSLPPGTYTLTASAPGFILMSAAGVVVTAGNTTTRDFSLMPAPTPSPVRNLIDLNADGSGDVFLYNKTSGARSFQVSSAAGFAASSSAWDPGWQVYPASLNADGYADFFLYDPARGYWIQALNHAGDGTFAYTLGNWDSSWTVVPSDLDGDGLTDMFVYNFSNGVWVKCFVDGSGGFKGYAAGNWDPGWTFSTADLNGDGRDDFFLYNRTNGVWVEAFSQAGFGGFDYPASGQWDPGWQLTRGDLNRDGRTDLFLLNAEGVHVSALSRAGGGFDYVGGPQWSPGWSVRAGDLDGDGASDLFLYNPTNGVWVQAFSDGTGGFNTAASGIWDPGWTVATSDFNADGRADVLLSRADGTWVKGTNTGTGTFTLVVGNWGTGWTVFVRRLAEAN